MLEWLDKFRTYDWKSAFPDPLSAIRLAQRMLTIALLQTAGGEEAGHP
jgi:hypothetical protein